MVLYIYRSCSSFRNIGYSRHTSIWPYSVRQFWLGSKLARWTWLHLKLSVARCWLGGLFFWNPVGSTQGRHDYCQFVAFEMCVPTISTCVAWSPVLSVPAGLSAIVVDLRWLRASRFWGCVGDIDSQTFVTCLDTSHDSRACRRTDLTLLLKIRSLVIVMSLVKSH
jgi:hypothetical protein